MEKRVIVLMLCLLGVSSLISQWNNYTIDAYRNTGWHTITKLDSNGNPHIVYRTAVERGAYLYYTYNINGSWETVSISELDLGSGRTYGNQRPYDILIEDDGTTNIFYLRVGYNYVNNNRFYVRSGTINNWSTREIRPLISDGTYRRFRNAVCFLKSNNRYFLFFGGTAGLSYITSESIDGEWSEIQYIEDGAIEVLALDSITAPNGNIHLAYHCSPGNVLKHAYYDGEVWRTQIIDGVDADVGANCSIILDSNNNPRISYYDATNGQLKFVTLTPNN